MKTGRPDLDAMIRVSSIPADEPTFLLRGQDACAADTVRDWAARELAAGVDKAVVEQGLRQADAMARWPVKKLPTADHLAEAERQRLAYAYDRRIWKARSSDPVGYIAALRAEARALLIVALEIASKGAFGDGGEAIAQAIDALDGAL